MKRLFDILMSSSGLFVLMPVFMVIGAGIKLYDSGPFFFTQTRVGKDGKLFLLYKFRSMKVDESGNDGSFEPGDSSRITPPGRILRKTKLDELPQLFNVLIGNMSLVGPRPEVQKWVDAFPSKWKKIHTMRPGITDNASVCFRHEERLLAESSDPERLYREVILPRKLELYDKYVDNHTFFNDIKLILQTIYIVFRK